jgi:VanZ family protein
MEIMQPFDPLRVGIKKVLLLWAPVFVWMGLIYYLSAQPDLAITEGVVDLIFRKIAHMGEYAILFLFLLRALKGSFAWKTLTIFVIAAVVSFLYATSDEFHQTLVPTRAGMIYDVGFDLFGILIGVWFARLREER